MLNKSTDQEWEEWGVQEPYYGVLTHENYLKTNLSDENREYFFRSGYDYIDNVLKKIRKNIDAAYTPKKALDFGCGVGRLVIPLSKVAEEVVGVDVSESMLSEAKRNCEVQSIKNVSFLKSDDELSSLTDEYDFINSFIVFQHIPVKRGERIFEHLLAHLGGGGICVVQFIYAKRSREKKVAIIKRLIKDHIPLAKNIINLAKGRAFFAPQNQMQMNAYDLNMLFAIMKEHNITEVYAEHFCHEDIFGVILYARKLKEM